MHFLVRLLVVAACGTLVAIYWWSPSQEADAAEKQASLFDNRSTAHGRAKLDVTVGSIDTRETLKRWAAPTRKQVRQAAVDTTTSLLDLMTFTSTSYAADTKVVSVKTGSGADDPKKCSVGDNAPDKVENNCSVGKSSQGDVNACSTSTVPSNPDPPASGFGGCSTKAGGTGTGTVNCSAFVDGPKPGGDNTACSAAGDGQPTPKATACSAGPDYGAGSVACSTGGGDTPGPKSPEPSDGAVVCSALGAGVTGNSCSTKGGGDNTVTCSTYFGEHQACSAGVTDPDPKNPSTNSATCSATGANKAGKTATCSVTGGGPAGPNSNGNKCSAIAYNTPPGSKSTAHCSTDSGDAKDGNFCSVMASATPNNTICSAIPGYDDKDQPLPLPGGYTCSVKGATKDTPNNTCSVITPGKKPGDPPTVTPPADPTQGYCGGPIKGHHGVWPPPKK